jgi:ribonucleoside-triphosphate reductase
MPITNLIDQYLNKTDWQINENANQCYSLQEMNNYISSEVSKEYWLSHLYPAHIAQATKSGDIHIHDLQTISSYCAGWDLQDILTVGFSGVSNKVEAKPPSHFSTALGQLVNFFYTLQGECAGAQAISNFDTLLAPFIFYDQLTQEQVNQKLQEFVFNMNVPTRVGFQTPFTNVTLDLLVPKHLASQPVIIGGKPQDKTYGDFQHEVNMFNQAFTQVIGKGDAKNRVFTFPIPTYSITKNFNWDDPNLDHLWAMTAKYGIPYFSNFVNSDMNPEDARSMCCRLRLDNRELRKRGGGLFGANPLTGSLGVVTINLPRIGYLSKNKQEFFDRLSTLMDISKESLEIKRSVIEKLTLKGLYPYAQFYLRAIKAQLGSYWGNHFSTIGLIGMNEALLNLLHVPITNPEGQKFAQQVLEFMRAKTQEYQETTGTLYNLEATPAEGTAYRFARKDKELYPNIIVANESAWQTHRKEPFYTNSSHIPVDYTNDIFELLDLQDELQIKYTGGTVVHIFVGEEITDISMVKSLVKKICNTYQLPYFTLCPTFSVCPDHGYLKGKTPLCPTCQKVTSVYSRIVGYLRPVSHWNPGKKAEFDARNTYDVFSAPIIDELSLEELNINQFKKLSPVSPVQHL